MYEQSCLLPTLKQNDSLAGEGAQVCDLQGVKITVSLLHLGWGGGERVFSEPREGFSLVPIFNARGAHLRVYERTLSPIFFLFVQPKDE